MTYRNVEQGGSEENRLLLGSGVKDYILIMNIPKLEHLDPSEEE